MKKINVFNFIIILSILQSILKGQVCSNSNEIKNSIKSIEKQYISEGSFGQVWGNDKYVSKTMKTQGQLELELLNNELKVMLAFQQEHDIMGLYPQSCYYEKINYSNDYQVKIKMYRMSSTLKEQIKDGILKNNIFWKLDIMFQIATGIKKLHDRGIKHLDLKEMNIMMMNRYTPVIADFGFVLFPNQNRAFECGTPLFMAPEIYKGIYSRATDIYALGIIYFQLLNSIFVRSQNFRTTCNYLEWTYEKIYCRLAPMIDQMLNQNFEFRPNINQIALKIAKEIAYQKYYNPTAYNEYVLNQQLYYKSTLSFTTSQFVDTLKDKLQQRTIIYDQVYDNIPDKQIQNTIQLYCNCKTSPSQIFNKYNAKYDLVGSQVRNENVEQSLQSLRDRIQQAERNRNVGLQENNFIKKQDLKKPQQQLLHNPQIINKPLMKESKREAPLLNGEKKFAKIVFVLNKKKEEPKEDENNIQQQKLQENMLEEKPQIQNNIQENQLKQISKNRLQNLTQTPSQKRGIHKQKNNFQIKMNKFKEKKLQIIKKNDQKQQEQDMQIENINEQINMENNPPILITNQNQHLLLQILPQLENNFDMIHNKIAIPPTEVLNTFLKDLEIVNNKIMPIKQENQNILKNFDNNNLTMNFNNKDIIAKHFENLLIKII